MEMMNTIACESSELRERNGSDLENGRRTGGMNSLGALVSGQASACLDLERVRWEGGRWRLKPSPLTIE